METSGSITCSGVQLRGDLGGAVRTKERTAWESSTQYSWCDFRKQVIYCQRWGCFASTKQNEMKVSIKYFNKMCKRATACFGQRCRKSHTLCAAIPFFTPLLCPAPPGPRSPGCHFGWREAVEVAAHTSSVHHWRPPRVSGLAHVPPSAISALENQQNLPDCQAPSREMQRHKQQQCPSLAAKGQAGSEVGQPSTIKCLHIIGLWVLLIFASSYFAFFVERANKAWFGKHLI